MPKYRIIWSTTFRQYIVYMFLPGGGYLSLSSVPDRIWSGLYELNKLNGYVK